MKKALWFLCLSVTAVFAEVKYHACEPSAFSEYCVLHYVFYNQSDAALHQFPQNYSRVRIGADFLDDENKIPYFDMELYKKLGKPRSLQVLSSGVTRLEISRELKEGRFSDNTIDRFWIEEGDSIPVLEYLDLYANYLRDLRNVSHFVNLETLDVSFNSLDVIAPDIFQNLTKLKYLSMNANNILKIFSLALPTSLTHLNLRDNRIEELDYDELRFPSLIYLDLEANQLSQLDAAELLLAMPKLRDIRFGDNLFERQDILSAIEIFERFNVSYKRDDEDLDPVVARVAAPKNVIQKVFCSLVVILFVAVGVTIVRLVIITMNK